MSHLKLILSVFLASVLLSGCSTIKGVGQDLAVVGEWITQSSDHVKKQINENPPGSKVQRLSEDDYVLPKGAWEAGVYEAPNTRTAIKYQPTVMRKAESIEVEDFEVELDTAVESDIGRTAHQINQSKIDAYMESRRTPNLKTDFLIDMSTE